MKCNFGFGIVSLSFQFKSFIKSIKTSMTLHKITEFYAKWFSVCPNITSKFRTIAIFKNFVNENILL
jgi:hypothetical protein